MRLFDEHGFAGTTVDEIAEAAGVSRATVFTYFPTKEEIVFGDAAAAVDGACGATARGPRTSRPSQRPRLAGPLTGWLEPELLLQHRLPPRSPPSPPAGDSSIAHRGRHRRGARGRARPGQELAARLAAASLIAALNAVEGARRRADGAGRPPPHRREIDRILDAPSPSSRPASPPSRPRPAGAIGSARRSGRCARCRSGPSDVPAEPDAEHLAGLGIEDHPHGRRPAIALGQGAAPRDLEPATRAALGVADRAEVLGAAEALQDAEAGRPSLGVALDSAISQAVTSSSQLGGLARRASAAASTRRRAPRAAVVIGGVERAQQRVGLCRQLGERRPAERPS